MNNIFDNLIDALGNNKKNLIIVSVVYIVIVISILLVIWWPDGEKALKYESINIEDKQQELAEEYIGNIALMFMTDNKDIISDLISDDYVEYTGKSKASIIQELDEQGFFNLQARTQGVELYVDENTYIYKTTINYKENSRSISIIETYPYKYKIVFDDFYKYDTVEKTTSSQGIKFTVTDIYRNLKYIKVNMKIENTNSSYVRFDFNSLNCVQAVLEDGKSYSASNLVSGSNYTDVNSSTTITKNFVFEIPAQLQNHIKYIVFNGIKLEFSSTNIKVDI